MTRYLKPRVLIIDELGYLPIDKFGADLLFQIFSRRYERGSAVVTTNRAYKHWPEVFNNDSTLTSALLAHPPRYSTPLCHEFQTGQFKRNSRRRWHTPNPAWWRASLTARTVPGAGIE